MANADRNSDHHLLVESLIVRFAGFQHEAFSAGRSTRFFVRRCTGGGWLSTLRALGVKWWCFFHSAYVTGFPGAKWQSQWKNPKNMMVIVMVDTWLL